MKYCPECGTPVEPGDEYCPECGTTLARFRIGEDACVSCGSLLVKIGEHVRCPICDSFCSECGSVVTKKDKSCPGCEISFKKHPKKRHLGKYPKDGHPLYKSPMHVEYSGSLIRLLALLIDIIVVGAAVSVVGVAVGIRFSGLPFLMLMAITLLLYSSVLIGLNGATLGMTFYSLRIVDLKGERIGLLKGLVRSLLGAVSLASVVGVLLSGVHRYKQAAQDLLMKTYVIRVKD